MTQTPIIDRLEEAYAIARQKMGVKKIPNKRAFAEALGMSYSQVSSMFTGARAITEKTANQVERVFGVSRAWLLYGKGEKEVKKGTLTTDVAERYLSDSVIYHVAPDELASMMAGDESRLRCWSYPGLKGEYYSFSMFVRNNLYIPYGSTVIARELDNKVAQPAERMYVIINDGKIHFTSKPFSCDRIFVVLGHVPPMLK